MNKCVACNQPIYYPNKGETRHECPKASEASRLGKMRSEGFVNRPPTYLERLHLGMTLIYGNENYED